MREKMKQNFGFITLDFVPARCTSVGQVGDQPEVNNNMKSRTKA